MGQLLKCFCCGKRASYTFKKNEFIRKFDVEANTPDFYINICVDCNKEFSTEVQTHPIFQVLKGGKDGKV